MVHKCGDFDVKDKSGLISSKKGLGVKVEQEMSQNMWLVERSLSIQGLKNSTMKGIKV